MPAQTAVAVLPTAGPDKDSLAASPDYFFEGTVAGWSITDFKNSSNYIAWQLNKSGAALCLIDMILYSTIWMSPK